MPIRHRNLKGTQMELRTITVKGVELDVFYEYSSERDPLGTGDSPTAHYVEIRAVETTSDAIDIVDLLSNDVLNEIEQEIINIEVN